MFENLKAIWGSLLCKDLDYHPRQHKQTIAAKDVVNRIKPELERISFKCDELELLVDRAKDSLEEAKSQTEYQDGKAARLLTIVAFLTAAVGMVFGKFIDVYPLHKSLSVGGLTSFSVALTYLLFGIYLLLVATGAMVTFHAMSTRFVWPEGGDHADRDSVSSFLFFKEIIRTEPEAWARAFAEDKEVLLLRYYRNYVAEAYLVAAKVGDKLRYLEPGQRLLLWGIRVLLVMFIFTIITFALVPSTRAEDSHAIHGVVSAQPSLSTSVPGPPPSAAAASANPQSKATPGKPAPSGPGR